MEIILLKIGKLLAWIFGITFVCLLKIDVSALSLTNNSINFSGTYTGVENTVGVGISLQSLSTSGEYLSPVIDLGANINSIKSIQWLESGIVANHQDIVFETRTAQNASSGPIANTVTDSFVDISKLNALSCTNYQVTSGQLKMAQPILGDGTDGALTLSTSKNINTEGLGSNSDGNGVYADGIAYKVSGISGSTITTSTSALGFVANDKVLLIDLQGTASDYGTVGNYEILTVSSISMNSVNLTSSPTKDYDGSGNSFTNQKVVIQRIPQYTNVTVNSGGTITISSWEGLTTTPIGNAGFYTGIITFYAKGTITINTGGSIDAVGKGFRGGYGYYGYGANNYQGESIIGLGVTSRSASAGGAGGAGYLCADSNTSSGGGGSYATSGAIGGMQGSCTRGAGGIFTYGTEQLNKLYFGAGGGASYGGTSPYTSGGIVLISASTLTNSGTIRADGTGGDGTGNDASGSGAGGSLRIDAMSVTTGTMSAIGGLGFSYYNGQVGNNTGQGGDGRVAIYYVTSLSGSATPTAYTLQSALEYPTSSSIVSSDILLGIFNVNSIESIMYNLSSKPSGTDATIQFSTDGTNWFNKDKTSGSDTLSTGLNNEIVLTNYSGSSFYYAVSFSGDGTSTPVLNDITLNYTNLPNNYDSFDDSSKINTTLSYNYLVSGGQARLGLPIDGTDGALTVSSSKNLNTESLGSDSDDNGSYADGIAYRVSGISGSTVTTSTNANGFVADDKVLLIDLQGTAGDYGSVGNYEILTVSSVSTNSVYLTSSPVKDYDGSGNSYTNQKVIMQRIPQYTNVTVSNGGTITASAWDGLITTPTGNAGFHTGIVAFYVNGTITVNTGGIIDVSGKGFRGGPGIYSYGANNYQGESIIGLGAASQSASAGGGGGSGHLCGDGNTSGGGGGSYATSGATGGLQGSCTRGSAGTYTYGAEQLDKLFFGAGGGAGYGGASTYPAGGIILISSNILTNNGTIKADGTSGNGTGNDSFGSGAGGSLRIDAASIQTGTMSAVGGLGFSYYNNQVGNNTGKGGDGRIAIYYITSLSGSSSPVAYSSHSSVAYSSSGSLISTNLLSGIENIYTIDSITYNLSSIPSGSTATIQFSNDGTNWYDKNKYPGSEDLTTGLNNTILLTNYPCDAFYYKVTFTGDGTNTPVLNDIVLDFSGYNWGAWSGSPYLSDPNGSSVTSTTQRYLQYRAIFTTDDAGVSPLLSSVTVNYFVTKLWDELTRLQISTESNHRITFWTDYGLFIGTADTMVLSFDAEYKSFDLSNLEIGDIELTDNVNTVRTLGTIAGEDVWGVSINMADDTITFSVPTSGTGGYTALEKIIIKIGTNATGGSNQIINPGTAGIVQEKIVLNNSLGEEGVMAIPIVVSDSVTITGSVAGYITFDIDTGTGEIPGTDNVINCDSSGAGACLTHSGGSPAENYIVDLGELTYLDVNKSNSTSVTHSDGLPGAINSIYFDLTTNIPAGVIVSVNSANGGLQGPGSSKIQSVTDGENILANIGKYGFNLPVASHLNYGAIIKNSDCDTSSKYCGPSLTPKTVFTTNNAQVELARVRMDIAAAASYTNIPGYYTDTLTFMATGTF